MTFHLTGLCPALVDAAERMGLRSPSAIQAAAFPLILSGRDLCASAPTGSGKTAAYLLPLLQRWSDWDVRPPLRPFALVVVPTRELAAQVGEAAQALAASLDEPVKTVVAFGGVSINPQMMRLRGGADLIVATPGRLLDLVDRHALKLDALALLVLDEADRLLDEGFAAELERLRGLLPARRQTLLFSATLPLAVDALARHWLHDPAGVAVAPDARPAGGGAGELAATAAGWAEPPSAAPSAAGAAYAACAASAAPAIAQRAIQVDTERRTALLCHLIADQRWTRVLVFVATQYASEHVAGKLRQRGLAAAALRGGLSQGARTRLLADFKAGRVQVLVATDLAARGLDIPLLPAVVNHDLPRSAADHTHRIGRTGRAGASGVAVSFVSPSSEAHFRLIEKRQALRVPREQVAGFEPVHAPAAEAPATGGIKGARKSKKDRLRESLREAAAQEVAQDVAQDVSQVAAPRLNRPASGSG